MKSILALSILTFAGSLHAADPALTTAERAHALQLLEDSQKEFLALVDGLNDAQWTFKPGPDRWSVGETAEHIVLAEAMLFGSVQRAVEAPPNPDWETKTRGKTEFIEKVMVDRTHKATAPEAIQPHAKMSREEVIQRYKEQRAHAIQFAEETQGGFERTHRGPSLPRLRDLERIPVADLRPTAQRAPQSANRRSKSQPRIPEIGKNTHQTVCAFSPDQTFWR
ncbi:MAG TPA: DinB family protein [Bryobacteraceae bacterium]|nr:DinB family protein [Bryobacteraceae bacterium]